MEDFTTKWEKWKKMEMEKEMEKSFWGRGCKIRYVCFPNVGRQENWGAFHRDRARSARKEFSVSSR